MPSCHPAILVVRKVLQTGLANSSTLVRTWSSLPGERFMGCKAHLVTPNKKHDYVSHMIILKGRNFAMVPFSPEKAMLKMIFHFLKVGCVSVPYSVW